MADNENKLYMEMQMDELKASLGDEEEDSVLKGNKEKVEKEIATPKNSRASKNAEVAKLYEDAAEYEEELQGFEDELEIINAYELKNIAGELTRGLPDEDRNYEQELKAILVAAWTHFVETEKTHPIEQLELIKETEFSNIVEKLGSAYPNYDGDFETAVREILVKRLETLIAIKKEHIAQEIEEIYIAGLKPSFVKRIYKQFHGIS